MAVHQAKMKIMGLENERRAHLSGRHRHQQQKRRQHVVQNRQRRMTREMTTAMPMGRHEACTFYHIMRL